MKTLVKITELEEITEGKNLDQLQKELDFQIGNGENLGGAICSFIIGLMDVKKRDFDGQYIKGSNFMTPTKIKSFVNNLGMRVEISEGTGFTGDDVFGVVYATDSGIILHNLSAMFEDKKEAFKHSQLYKK